MDNTQTLELQIVSTAKNAKVSIDSLVKSLTNIENVLTNIYLELGQIETKSGSSIKNVNANIKSITNGSDKLNSSFSRLNKTLFAGGIYLGVKKLSTTFLNWMGLAVDRTEQLNLFNVVFKNIEKNGVETFSTLGKEATRFQYKLNEAFGTNFTETTKYQGLFQSMGLNIGIPDTYSSIMSETMTKLTYDLASLYNKQESVVAEALRAGVYAGQTKPLRSYGVDVTQTSLQPILTELGITDRTVKQLSQAEKEILRYLATLKQAKMSMGDFANTIESPSNQLKVFKQQLVEAKVALTSLFIGTYSKILPYANAILMVIKEVSKAIANMFGIKLQDYNSGIATQEEAFEDLSDSVDGATGSVKKLKREVLSFDQIHNINENKDSSGSASQLTGGIDQRLLDAIYGYDNGMDKVRMKATEIRDKIMEWLGFTKEINPLTGEVSFKLTNTNSTMGKVINSLKKIVKYGKEAITGVLKVIKKDFDNSSFGKIIATTFETIANLLKFIAKNKNAQTIIAKLVEAFVGFKVVKGILSPVISVLEVLFTKIGGLSSAIGLLKTSLSGFGIFTAGLIAVHDSISSIVSDGANFVNVFEGIGGTIASVGGAVVALSSLLGPVGTVLGVIIGLMGSLAVTTNTLMEDSNSVENRIKSVNTTLNDYRDAMLEADEAKQKYLEKSLNELAYYEDLYQELKLITDENGRIKDGYETRANFIVNELSNALGIEISIIDGTIQKYNELEKSVNSVIEAKRAQYLLDANTEKYNLAKDRSVELEKAYADAVKNTKDVVEQSNPTFNKLQEYFKLSDEELQNFINTGVLSLKHVSIMTSEMSNLKDSAIRYREQLEKARESEEKAGQAWADNQKIIGDYEMALGYLTEQNYNAVFKIYKDTVDYQGKTVDETKKNYSYAIESQKRYLKELEDNKYNYDEEYLKQEKNRTKLKIQQLEDEQKQVEEEIKRQNEITKLKTLEGINEQLKVFKDHKYEFREASDGNMQLYVDGIESGNTISQKTMTKLVEGTIQKIKDKKMSAKEAGEYLVDGVNLGLSNSSKQSKSYSIIGTFTNNIINKFKQGLGINSPSKITQEYGKYLIEGLNVGVDTEKKNALNNIADFTKDVVAGMDMDLGRFVMDFNRELSNASIDGNISNKSSLNISGDMASKIGYYVSNAINNRPIQVDLDVHSDEGVIVDRINQTTKQTGVCPINIPI